MNILSNVFRKIPILKVAGLPHLHYSERLLWLLFVFFGTGCAFAVCYSNWTRYWANPTVVSLQKDFRNWNNPLPAATVCYDYKVDDDKAEKFIFQKWGVNKSQSLFDYYFRFVKTVANISYQNLFEFEQFLNDESLTTIDLIELVSKVHPNLSGTLVTFDLKKKINWTLVLSEMGVCFSINGQFTHLFSLSKNKTSNSYVKILRCHYLNGLCYARYDVEIQKPLKYYIHSYLDVVHATIEPPWIVQKSKELEINYRMQETSSSLNLRDLSVSQRGCRFFDEPLDDNLPVFSTSICYINCRYKLALKYCGCKPFFYHNFEGKNCDLNGLVCLAKYSVNITKPPSEIGCQCPEPCNKITYIPQVPKYTKWEYGYFDYRITFRWGLLPPTTKYRRDILFGFGELVVSFGGTLALFLGISFISGVEIMFIILQNLYQFSWFSKKCAIVIFPPSGQHGKHKN